MGYSKGNFLCTPPPPPPSSTPHNHYTINDTVSKGNNQSLASDCFFGAEFKEYITSG